MRRPHPYTLIAATCLLLCLLSPLALRGVAVFDTVSSDTTQAAAAPVADATAAPGEGSTSPADPGFLSITTSDTAPDSATTPAQADPNAANVVPGISATDFTASAAASDAVPTLPGTTDSAPGTAVSGGVASASAAPAGTTADTVPSIADAATTTISVAVDSTTSNNTVPNSSSTTADAAPNATGAVTTTDTTVPTATDVVASPSASDAVPSTSTGAQLETDPQLSIATATATATVTERHLPAWVQVAVASGTLYAADTGSVQVQSHLARNTYLRVLAGGTARLQVQAYDESGNPGQTGWAEADQVLPSAPATGWLVSSAPTTLWSAADAAASQVRALDRFTPLQQIDGPVQGRVLVAVYRADFSGIQAQGWVDSLDTGPALAPSLRVAAPADPALSQHAASSPSQADFLSAAIQAARQGSAATGVPASVSVAQAILESDWGRSTLAQDANNYFGMKAMGTLGNDGVVWMPTSEYNAAGQLYQTTSAFRAYKSLADSLQDHDELLERGTRYAPAMQATQDPKQFAQLIAQAGYSTDPAYADKLIALMDHYNLYQFDS